jgi:hypothetical protein
MPRLAALAGAIVVLASAFPVTAFAQREPASVHGAVKAEGGSALDMAEVRVFGTEIRTRSGDDGAFRLTGIKPGRYFIGVRRLGFKPLVFTVTLESKIDREMDVELEALPTNFSPVKVEARSDFSRVRYGDLMWRRRTAWGDFITRDDIDREKPYSISWMISRYLPGVTPQMLEEGANPADYYTPASFGSLRRDYGCAPAVSINGSTPTLGWGLKGFPTEEIEAVEVYRGRSTRLPMELSNQSTRCGVVVVWLR